MQPAPRLCESRRQGVWTMCQKAAEWVYHGAQQRSESQRLILFLCDEHAKHHTIDRPSGPFGRERLKAGVLHEGYGPGLYLEPLARAEAVA